MRSVKKAITVLFFAAASFQSSSFYSQTFTWIHGTSMMDQFGIYGTLGTPAAANAPGGRVLSATWTDLQGNLWLFSGRGFGSSGNMDFLNDMWKYNVTTNQWTWVCGVQTGSVAGIYGTKGVGSTSNMPGGRKGAVTWTDAGGNLLMFGGYGYDNTATTHELNDLWKFNTTSLQWTWISGSSTGDQNGVYGSLNTPSSSNQPGGRESAVGYKDASGNLYVFGGYGLPATGIADRLNDFWKYSPATGNWTWIGGATFFDENGIYGTMGTPASANRPGARAGSAGWQDNSGNMWLFGGDGYPATGGVGQLSDIWKYSLTTNEWTWMKGPNTRWDVGSYGVMGTSAPSNLPPSRFLQVSWAQLQQGYLWLWSGSSNSGVMNDLWRYDIGINEWTWMKGSNTSGQTGVYGTMGVASASNIPGARWGSVGWTGSNGKLWIFGGEFGNKYFNDLWTIDLAGIVNPNPVSIAQSENEESTLLQVYPNPATDVITINSSIEGQIRVKNCLGEIIYENDISHHLQLNTSEWPSGIYLLWCNEQVEKFVVTH
jgi:N-acetylneuraminic acid mutarotase